MKAKHTILDKTIKIFLYRMKLFLSKNQNENKTTLKIKKNIVFVF